MKLNKRRAFKIATFPVIVMVMFFSSCPLPIDSNSLTDVAVPVFLPAEGAIVANTELELSCATTNASIRYTLDNSEPDESSPLYDPTAKLKLIPPITVKARAYLDGMNPSAVVKAAYTNISLTLTVVIPSADTISLAGQKIILSRTTGMTVNASVVGAVSYQWYLDSTPLSGQTAASTTFTADLAPGTYELSVAIKTASTLLSERCPFEVRNFDLMEYFPTQPGYSVPYILNRNGTKSAGSYPVTLSFQNSDSGLLVYQTSSQFAEKAWGESSEVYWAASNTEFWKVSGCWTAKPVRAFFGSLLIPQACVAVPYTFSPMNDPSVFTVNAIGSQTVNGTVYDDCVEIVFDTRARQSTSWIIGGTGSYVFAKGVGIIKWSQTFNKNDYVTTAGDTDTAIISGTPSIENELTLAGTVKHTNSASASDSFVTIDSYTHNYNFPSAKVASNGSFAIPGVRAKPDIKNLQLIYQYDFLDSQRIWIGNNADDKIHIVESVGGSIDLLLDRASLHIDYDYQNTGTYPIDDTHPVVISILQDGVGNQNNYELVSAGISRFPIYSPTAGGTIHGFHDRNNNGSLDSGEPGVVSSFTAPGTGNRVDVSISFDATYSGTRYIAGYTKSVTGYTPTLWVGDANPVFLPIPLDRVSGIASSVTRYAGKTYASGFLLANAGDTKDTICYWIDGSLKTCPTVNTIHIDPYTNDIAVLNGIVYIVAMLDKGSEVSRAAYVKNGVFVELPVADETKTSTAQGIMVNDGVIYITGTVTLSNDEVRYCLWSLYDSGTDRTDLPPVAGATGDYPSSVASDYSGGGYLAGTRLSGTEPVPFVLYYNPGTLEFNQTDLPADTLGAFTTGVAFGPGGVAVSGFEISGVGVDLKDIYAPIFWIDGVRTQPVHANPGGFYEVAVYGESFHFAGSQKPSGYVPGYHDTGWHNLSLTGADGAGESFDIVYY